MFGGWAVILLGLGKDKKPHFSNVHLYTKTVWKLHGANSIHSILIQCLLM